MTAKAFDYFFGDKRKEIERLLMQNKCRDSPEKWLKSNLAAGILLGISALVIVFFLGGGESAAITAFFTAAPLPLILNFFWQGYKAELRKREIDSYTADLLLYASSLPRGMPMTKMIEHLGKADYGALSEEFARAGEELQKGLAIHEALSRIGERNNSQALNRALDLLIEAYHSGADMNSAFRNVAEDILETQAILRERASAMVIEKYTLLLSAGAILPAILGMVTRLVESLNFELLSELEIGLGKEAREALFGASMTAMAIYLVEYCILASAFVAIEENKPKKAFIYVIVLVPLSLAVHFAAKTI